MRKRLGYFFASIGVLFTLMVIPAVASATEEEVQNIIVDEKDAFLDSVSGKMINAYKEVNGQLVSIDKEEYQEITEDYEEEVVPYEDFSISPMAFFWYQYYPATSTILSYPIKKSSASINCNVETCTAQKTQNTTVTESFTAGLTSGGEGAIKANAGYAWSKSAINGSAYSFTVKKGVKGYIGFSAKYRKTTGELKSWMDSTLLLSQTVEGRSAKTIDGTATGELDGVYTWVYE